MATLIGIAIREGVDHQAHVITYIGIRIGQVAPLATYSRTFALTSSGVPLT